MSAQVISKANRALAGSIINELIPLPTRVSLMVDRPAAAELARPASSGVTLLRPDLAFLGGRIMSLIS